MKYKQLKAPKGPQDIAKQLRWLSEHAIDIGTSMDYLAGFDVHMAARGKDLVGAGLLMLEWADSIEEKLQ